MNPSHRDGRYRGDRRFIDDGETARVTGDLGNIGDGNFSSGDYSATGGIDPDFVYGYAGYHGDTGLDEYGEDQYGGGRYGRGPIEQSQQFGDNGFGTGQGPFGSLQRQYQNRFVAGGHRGSYGDRYGYSGPDDAGVERGHLPGHYWRDDTGTRRWDEHEFYPESRDRSWRWHVRRTLDPGSRDLHSFAIDELNGSLDGEVAPDYADPAGFEIFDIDDPLQAEPQSLRRPKGYRRCDERILEDAYLRLLQASHVDSSDVAVEMHDGYATLTGTVPERWMKYVIENLVARSRDVRDVENRIRVRSLLDPPKADWHDDHPLSYSSAGS